MNEKTKGYLDVVGKTDAFPPLEERRPFRRRPDVEAMARENEKRVDHRELLRKVLSFCLMLDTRAYYVGKWILAEDRDWHDFTDAEWAELRRMEEEEAGYK